MASPIAKPERRTKGKTDMPAPVSGKVSVHGSRITIAMKETEERIYEVEHTARLNVESGQEVSAGDFLTEGSANPPSASRIEVPFATMAVNPSNTSADGGRGPMIIPTITQAKIAACRQP